MPVSASTTAHDLIKRSMRLCAAIGKGETPDDDEAQDCLTALNALLDSWANYRLYVYRIMTTGVSITAGVYDYSITSLYDTTDDVPVRWDRGTNIEVSGIHYPIEAIEAVQYGQIADTTQTGRPRLFWFRRVPPDVRLTLWPVPDASATLWLHAWVRLQKFSSLTQAITLPPGYLRALAFSLAEDIAPEYGGLRDASVPAIAARARNALTAINAPRLRMETSADMMDAGLFRQRGYNITTGW